MGEADIARALESLTVEEKAALLSGQSIWEAAGAQRLGVLPVTLTDGPHGLRMQDPDAQGFDLGASAPATCFPTAAALGSSWDPGLLTRIGQALGAEARAAGVSVLLGPGVNIKRSPLCGRNFEYLSEDPVVAGRLGAALVRGIQDAGVGACAKHFAANNQETDRMRVSAEVDERTLREVYLPAFEHIVGVARPCTVMAAYNRVNGVHAAQHRWLLTTVLREEWGFGGVVVSDWCAVTDPVAALAAGLDLEMPGTGGSSAERIVAAVRAGQVTQAALDQAVARVLALPGRTGTGERPAGEPGWPEHHGLARLAAAESAVLLKNEGAILPLDPARGTRVAVIGELARTPVFQGGGSSQVNAIRVDNVLDALTAASERLVLSFEPGYTLSGQDDGTLRAEAVSAAAAADTVLLFLGLPPGAETEGTDRADITLPGNQLRLLQEVAEVSQRVVVVLANGGVVEVASWEENAAVILEGWLGGQAGGAAIADLLLGRANPCGRLAETIPLCLADNPSYLNFPGSEGTVTYGERLYVGYRYYDAKDLPVSYPFGHGLSYTTFAYSGLEATVEGQGDDAAVHVRFTLANTGAVAGKEVAQVYVRDLESSVDRPVRELRAFAKVEVAAGQSTSVEFTLRGRDLAFWSTARGGWTVEAGDFEVSVGASSRDLRLTATVTVDMPPLARGLTGESTVSEWLADPAGGPLLRHAMNNPDGPSRAADPAVLEAIGPLPLSRLNTMSGGRIDIDGLLSQLAATAVVP
jgi:beta-glucosidase